MKSIFLILFLCATTAFAAETKPALWAMYYAWYETGPGPHHQWKQWSEDAPTVTQPKPKSKAQPLLGFYDSDNPEVVRQHIRWAKAAGIDAFIVSWWGAGHLSGRTFEKIILPIAAEEHFHIGLCSELAQFHDDWQPVAEQMAGVLQRTKTNAAWLRVEGKPVIYLYQVPFSPKLTPETYRAMTHAVETTAGPVYWMMDKVANPNDTGLTLPSEWLRMPEIPMIGFYGTFSIERKWKYEDLARSYAGLVAKAHGAGKKIFLPVHPGHDNSGFRPDDNFVMPREDGATLRGYLKAATEAKADVVLLTSFNEWPETTVVEPSSSWKDPYQYLKIIAEWKGMKFGVGNLIMKRR